MAFQLRGGMPDNFAVEYPITAGTAIPAGTVLVISGNVVAPGDGNATIHTIVAVSAEAVSTAATTIKAIPITGPGQIWEATTDNNTNANQLFESQILGSTGATVVNNSTDVTGPTGVFTPFANLGAAADKRQLGEFTRLQSTST